MKNTAQHTKRLTALLKKIPAVDPPVFDGSDDPLAVLVVSFLLADATTEKAQAAFRKLNEIVVDYNDLRVSMPREVAGYLGARYPLGLERSQRLRAALRSIYLREHEVTLDPLKSAGKRDVKKYIESLEGMTPFVSARVLLLAFDTHAIPVDDQLLDRLVDEQVVDPDTDAATASVWLARQVKASDGLKTHYALQAWAESGPPRSKKKPPAKKSTTGKTTKKKTTAAKKAPSKTKTTTKKKTGTAR